MMSIMGTGGGGVLTPCVLLQSVCSPAEAGVLDITRDTATVPAFAGEHIPLEKLPPPLPLRDSDPSIIQIGPQILFGAV